MMDYMPKLIGKDGEKFFMFQNQMCSKVFYDAGKFDVLACQFPILNEKGEVVEYMDILGNFSKENTHFARKIYRYVTYEFLQPTILRRSKLNFYYFALADFPSFYLVDEKIKKFVIEEERRKYQFLINSHQFVSLFERLRYKMVMKQILREKLKKAKNIKKELEKEELIQTI